MSIGRRMTMSGFCQFPNTLDEDDPADVYSSHDYCQVLTCTCDCHYAGKEKKEES